MSASIIEPILHAVERRAIATVLRSHPEWTLGQVIEHVEKSGQHADAMRSLTIRELMEAPGSEPLGVVDGEKRVNAWRLRQAQRATGSEFDRHVLQIIVEAGQFVGASYLRSRVGGPRWKLRASLRRLEVRGEIDRIGETSATQYRAARP